MLFYIKIIDFQRELEAKRQVKTPHQLEEEDRLVRVTAKSQLAKEINNKFDGSSEERKKKVAEVDLQDRLSNTL